MPYLLVAAESIHGDLLGHGLVRKPTQAQLTMNVQINPEVVISRLQIRLEMLSKGEMCDEGCWNIEHLEHV